MEANRNPPRKWNSRYISTRASEYRGGIDSSGIRGHDHLLQKPETCGFRGGYCQPFYRRVYENPTTSIDSNCSKNNLSFKKYSRATLNGLKNRTLGNTSNDSIDVNGRLPHSHSFFQGKLALPQPRSVQLKTDSLRTNNASSYIPSPRNSSFKPESSSSIEWNMHELPVKCFSQLINSSNPNPIPIQCSYSNQSDKLDITPLENSSNRASNANITLLSQEAGNLGISADNSEPSLRNTVSSLFTGNVHALVPEGKGASSEIGITFASVPAPKDIQLLPPPPEYRSHLEGQSRLSSINALTNIDAPGARDLAGSDLYHMSNQGSSSPFLLEGIKGRRDSDSGESNYISIFKASDTPEGDCHISPASSKAVEEYTKLQAKLILADLDDNDNDYDSNNRPNRGTELINVLSESLEASLAGTKDCLRGAGDELAKAYSNTLSTSKGPNTFFNSQSMCKLSTPDATKISMTPAICPPALDRGTTALFLQLTGESEGHEGTVHGSLHATSTGAASQVTCSTYDEDPRNNNDTGIKTLFSDLFSELTEPNVCMVSDNKKYSKGTESNPALSVDGAQSDNFSKSVLQQLEHPMELFRFDEKLKPTMADMVMGREALDRENCIDLRKNVRPQNRRGVSVLPHSVKDSADFAHNTIATSGTLVSVRKSEVMPAPKRSAPYNATAVRAQRPPLEPPLVTYQAFTSIFRENPQSMLLREKILERRLKVRPLIYGKSWPPKTGADVENLLKQHKAVKLLRHLTIVSFSRHHIEGVQELFNTWAQHGIPSPDMAFGAYYYYVKEKSEKLLCMKHNGRRATPGHGYGKCDFETRRPNSTCRYEHVCLFCRSKDHGWFEGDQCEGYQMLLSEIEALGVLEEDVKIMLDAMENSSTSI